MTLQYDLNNKMNLHIEPIYRYGIYGIENDSFRTVHLCRAGINISCYYRIK
jgi:hypothetical protein